MCQEHPLSSELEQDQRHTTLTVSAAPAEALLPEARRAQWLNPTSPSKALVPPAQPLPLPSRGRLSTKCLVSLWSGP